MRKTFLAALCGAVLSAGLAAPVFAGDRLDNIVGTNTLRVGTPGDYWPFSLKKDGQFVGHDIELVEEIAAVFGWEVEFVQTSWKTMADDLGNNKFDVVVGGITRTPARILFADFLPAYAPFGKVALVNIKNKDRFKTPEDLNQPDVRVIKNPGGTNEQYVLTHLMKAQVSTHDKNFEIPGLIAADKGDVMITETAEALQYAKKYKELYAAYIDKPLTPVNYMGFMLPTDDADYARAMNYAWDLLDRRGELKQLQVKWID